MTDEQIRALYNAHTEFIDDGECSYPRVDYLAFARALLSASIADTAGAKPQTRSLEVRQAIADHNSRIATPASSVAAPTAKSMRCPRGGGSCAVESCVEEGACTMKRVTESAPSVADAAGARQYERHDPDNATAPFLSFIPDAKRDELIGALLASLEKSDQRETDFYMVRSFIGGLGLLAAQFAPSPVESIADTAGAKPDPLVTLSGAQLLEAFNFVAPDHPNDPDQLECEVTIAYGEGHSGEGHYCWITDYPEEGAILLDGKQAQSIATPLPLSREFVERTTTSVESEPPVLGAAIAATPASSVADAAGALNYGVDAARAKLSAVVGGVCPCGYDRERHCNVLDPTCKQYAKESGK